jgi:hypothetical protein
MSTFTSGIASTATPYRDGRILVVPSGSGLPRFQLLQHPDDLRLCVPAPRHTRFPFLSLKSYSALFGKKRAGQRLQHAGTGDRCICEAGWSMAVRDFSAHAIHQEVKQTIRGHHSESGPQPESCDIRVASKSICHSVTAWIRSSRSGYLNCYSRASRVIEAYTTYIRTSPPSLARRRSSA